MTTSDNLGRQAARGAVVTVTGQGSRLIIQTAGIIVMARLLDPTDYGLLGMVAILIGLGEVFREFGLGAAAVQAETLSNQQRDNLFWANTALGLGLFVLAQLMAVPLAAFFDQPELVEITRVMALVFVFNGVSAQYRAQLTREMRFPALTLSEILGQVTGLTVGIATALIGWGYWALVAMQVTQAAATMILYVAGSGWLPGPITRGAGMRSFWTYGVNLVGSQIVRFTANNIAAVVIGHRLGPGQLGIYDRAYRLISVPLAQMRAPITTVALPTLSKIRDDQARYSRALLRGQIGIGYTFVPLLAVLAAANQPVVSLVLGVGWEKAAPVLGLFAVAGALELMAYVGYWVYLSMGLTKALFQYSLISASVRITCVLVASSWGTVGVAAGVAVATFLLWPLSWWWLSRRVALPIRALILGGCRLLGVATVAGLLAWLVITHMDSQGDMLRTAVAFAVVAATYLLASLLPSVRSDELTLLNMVKSAASTNVDRTPES